ncbi:xanthine dehydrogenase family protein molybdopterin-binding subunit [Saccharopolyspora sp. K220]|uniref:xanthine dehydrogenase family protein molybdopterin-binding subunit n=1 Tax=Saccharopolyspora soli TaxID=2926618 RepID=UPI001F56FF22|nr:xanthine dehydrogenase family protein molybdopterin-binding subunit [Saccharopolyspora soli]MCI2422241.1 xanthine dehydrogenase family protein molybdopterin-binding subunit [Saccharopolyspora soli]
MSGDERLVGRGIDRTDIGPLLDGSAAFVADLAPAGTLHAAFVRSGLPSARIAGVDTTAARSAPGVVRVLTGADLARHVAPLRPPTNSRAPERFTQFYDVRSFPRQIPCLAVDEVRYVGEAVAVVVATDRYLAEDAAALVEVDYEPREAVTDVVAALESDAPVVHADLDSNLAVSLTLAKGELPAGDDVVVVAGEYRIARQAGLSIECRGVLAKPENGRLSVWSSTQVPFILRQLLCAATGWSPDEVRVRAPEVGGGFGPKASVYAEEVVIPWLARELDRPVAWIEDRYENLTVATQARDNLHRTRLTVDRGGRILSWEDDFLVDLGVHNFWMVGVVANTAVHLLGAYRIPAVRITGRGVFSNKTPTAQYRGAGRPEASFALERSLDAAARRLGITPAKLRQQNLLGPDDLPHSQGVPYRDGVDIVYDGEDYARVLTAAMDLVGEDDIAELMRSAAAHERVGFGIGVYMEATARGPAEPETARVRLRDDGTLEVATGTGPSGQAHRTVFAQVAADAAQVGMDGVEVITADTDRVPQGLGSFASRSAVVAGSAVRLAVAQAVETGRAAVAELLRVSYAEPAPGGFRVPDTGRHVTWAELAALLRDSAAVIDEVHTFAPPTVTWTMGVHAVAVVVDIETGGVRVVRYGVAHETGSPLNPRVVDGQLRGGVVQGIGGALLERVTHDAAGQPQSVTLADYLVPEATDVPEVQLAHLDAPSQLNPLGIKGVGESGIIASGAAVAGAVDDALEEFGVHVACCPMTSDHLLELIEEARR